MTLMPLMMAKTENETLVKIKSPITNINRL